MATPFLTIRVPNAKKTHFAHYLPTEQEFRGKQGRFSY